MSQDAQDTSTIHNVRLDKYFTTTSNLIPEDPNLSWAAKGLLWYIVSRTENWQIHTWQLIKIYQGNKKGGGRDAIRNLLTELKENGYILHTKNRDKEGKWKHRYDVYPMRIKDFQKMFPETDKPSLVNPTTEKACVIPKTELPKTDFSSLKDNVFSKEKKDTVEQQHPLKKDQQEIFAEMKALDLGSDDKTLTIIIRTICKEKKLDFLKDCLNHIRQLTESGHVFKKEKIAYLRNILKKGYQNLITEQCSRNKILAEKFCKNTNWAGIEITDRYLKIFNSKGIQVKELPFSIPEEEFKRLINDTYESKESF